MAVASMPEVASDMQYHEKCASGSQFKTMGVVVGQSDIDMVAHVMGSLLNISKPLIP